MTQTLIERLEAANGPSRELDWVIAEHLGWTRRQVGQVIAYYAPGDPHMKAGPPKWSASIDAALTLVPEGDNRWPQLDYVGPNPNDSSKGHRWAIWLKKRSSKACRGHNKALSALALAAAALRAREVDRG